MQKTSGLSERIVGALKQPDFVVCAVLVGLVVVYFSKYIFSGLTFGGYDTVHTMFQMRSLAFGQGGIKFWNPYSQAGYPFFARAHTGYFAPLNTIYLFLDFARADKANIILLILMGGLGMYWYARHLVIGRPGAFLAATVFMFSGYTLLYHDTIGPTLLPLVFLFYEKTLAGKNKGSLVITVLLIATILLHGYVQWVLYLFYAMFLYWLFDTYWRRTEKTHMIGQNLGKLVFIAITTLLICAYQMLPAYELTRESIRGNGMSYGAATELAMHPKSLIHLLFPNFFYSFSDDLLRWGAAKAACYMYVGVLPLFLAIAAIIFKRDKKVYFFWTLLFICILVSFEKYLPLFGVMRNFLPGFKVFRDHPRILWLFSFSVAVLAGFGLDAILKKDIPDFSKKYSYLLKALFAVMLFILAVWLALFFLKDNIYAWAEKLIKSDYVGQAGHDHNYPYYLDKMKRIYQHLILRELPVSLGWYAVSLFALFLLKRLTWRLAAGFACSVAALNLFWYGSLLYMPAAKPEIFKNKPAYVDYLKKDKEVFRVFSLGGAVTPYAAMQYGYQDVKGNEPLMLMRFYKYMARANLKDRSPEINYNAKLLGFDPEEEISEYNKKMLDYLNVKYILSPRPLADNNYTLEFIGEEKGRRLLEPFGTMRRGESLFAFNKDSLDLPDILLYSDKVYIYKNRSYLPRAFLVYDYVVILEDEKTLDELSAAQFDPRKTVLLQKYVVLDKSPRTRDGIADKATIEHYSEDKIDLAAETAQPNTFLVLHDIYYPGWRAYLDGKPTYIYRANYLFRAILIRDPGKHKVSFIFRPRYLNSGVLLTALGLGLLVIYSIV